MVSSREAIAVALLALFKAAPGGFVTIGRRHIMPPQLSGMQQPALFLAGTMEDSKQMSRGVPGRTVVEFALFVYCQGSGVQEPAGEETAVTETVLNALLANIDAALAPDINGNQTLGGLVSHCWIEGQTFKDPGLLSDQAMAIVPVRMLVP